MRIIPINEQVIGKVLGHTVYDRAGRVLLRAGVELTERYVRQLRQRGYLSVAIDDPLAPDAVPIEVLQEETRKTATAAVERSFTEGKAEKIAIPVVERVIDEILNDMTVNPDLAYNVTALRSLEEGVFVHSVNVAVFSLILATSLGLERSVLRRLGSGALLHDIGKIYFMDLVNKQGRLTAQEFAKIQQHTTEGYDLLRHQAGIDLLAAHVAYQHHERLDGSGYPRGLRGDDIHLWARLVAVADIYDTVTADRTYGVGTSPHAAMDELAQMAAAGKVEPRFVRHLSHRLAAYPEGSILLLETGELAVVVGQTDDGQTPRVRVLTDANLDLVEPTERIADRSGPETTIRTVLQDYPLRVLEQVRRTEATISSAGSHASAASGATPHDR